MITKLFLAYVLTTLVFFGLDFLWIAVVMKKFYKNGIGHLMAENFKYIPIIVFYFLYTLGLFFFAIYPGYQKESIATAAILGSFLGLFAYTTYDLSNMGTLKDWPLRVTLIDILWGVIASSAVSSVGCVILQVIYS